MSSPPTIPGFRPSPSPASSTSWPRPRAAATATATPTGATSARASPRPGRCPARRRECSGSRSGWTTRSTRRCRASGSCAGRSPSCTTSSTARDKQSQYTELNVCICGGGRASLTRAVAALGADQPRPLPPRLHRVRGAARHLQALHLDPDPARGRARLPLRRRRPPARDHRPRPLGAAALESLQSDRQGDPGRRADGAGWRSRASWSARC